jgi:protein SCO1/2
MGSGPHLGSLPGVDRRLIAILFTAGALALGVMIFAIVGASGESDSAAVVQSPSSPFKGALLPPGVHAPDFALRDQDGRRITMKEYRGKVVVVTFLYSHCKDTCPVQAQQIKGALDDLGHDIPALSISVDPPGDKPKSVKHFNSEQGVTGRLRWVLGNESQLSRLWKGFAIIPQSPDQEHMARIVLVDRKGLQRIGFPASQVTPERLSHDIRALEAERG